MGDKIRHSKKRAFLAAYSECGNITHAAELANIKRCTVYEWQKDDPFFAAAMIKAEQQAADRLEQEARRRAVEGVRRYKFNGKGIPLLDPETGAQYCEHEFSDTLLIFLLKGIRPEKYRERISTEHTGKNGGPIEVKYDSLSDEELERAIFEALESAQGQDRAADPAGGEAPAPGHHPVD